MFVTVINIFLAAIAVGVLILVHELGHFLAAKAVGVRVETFSIGFWKKIVGFKKGPTEYRLSLIPLGGYVKLAGEMEGEGSGASDEFSSKSPGARAFVLVAGVGMNVVFALLAFVLAFTIGVPFEVAEVGRIDEGTPAWEAGMQPGDRVVRVNDVSNPDFQDLQRHVALLGRDSVTLIVEREGEELVFEIVPEYDEAAGMKLIGFFPPVEPVVTALGELNSDNGRSPAYEAGIGLGDRILSVDGERIEYFHDLEDALEGRGGETLRLEVERNGETLTFDVDTAKTERYVMGISGENNVVEALQGGGPAAEAGFREDDEIVSVGDVSVRSRIGFEEAAEEIIPDDVTVTLRRDGDLVQKTLELPDKAALNEFMFSFTTGTGPRLTWVRQDGPAWEAGMRPGDVVTEIAGREIRRWRDIVMANARLGDEERRVRWVSDGEDFESNVVPEKSFEGRARIGAGFNQAKTRMRRESVGGALVVGAQKTYGAFADMVFTIRGFARREVSTEHVGGIVLIAVASYHAAAGGMGQLLYFSALISAALAFLNILPIPVLDGGHLMFIGIEKVRGKPVSEKVRGLSQTLGLALLLLLVFYAIRNDILRLFS